MDSQSPDAENPEELLNKAMSGSKGPQVVRIIMALLSGVTSIAGAAAAGSAGLAVGSYTGGVLGATAAAWSEQDQETVNNIFRSWLKLQEDEIKEIGRTLLEVMDSLNVQDENVRRRMESPEYLRLIKKCFRDWSAAESEDKRVLIRNLLINAAGAQITTDDVVMIFVGWIDAYTEVHFKVIKSVYEHPGITIMGIWDQVFGGQLPTEDSPQADHFKLLIHDLSIGHIIRQHREKDAYGNFIRKQRVKQPRQLYSTVRTYPSAFDDGEQYELTGIGTHFVHYTMSEAVRKIGAGETAPSQSESVGDSMPV